MVCSTAFMDLGIYVLWLLWCSGFAKVVFLYLRLQLSIGCNLEYKYQNLYPLETANCSEEMAIWNTWTCRVYWSRLHQIWVNQAHYIIIYSFQWRSETVWVTEITLKMLRWGWLNGRYYLKNKFIPGETWQIELWSWHRVGEEGDWGKFNGRACIYMKSAKYSYYRTSL